MLRHFRILLACHSLTQCCLWAQEPADTNVTANPTDIGKTDDAETKQGHPTSPLMQTDLVLPDTPPVPVEAQNLGGGLFPPELWPLTAEVPTGAALQAGSLEFSSEPKFQPEEIWQRLSQIPAGSLTDPWKLLSHAESHVWQGFLDAYAPKAKPGTNPTPAPAHAPASVVFRAVAAPALPPPNKWKALADGWDKDQPVLISWITPQSANRPGQHLRLANTVLQKRCPELAKPFSETVSPGLEGPDQARAFLLQDVLKLAEIEQSLLHPAAASGAPGSVLTHSTAGAEENSPSSINTIWAAVASCVVISGTLLLRHFFRRKTPPLSPAETAAAEAAKTKAKTDAEAKAEQQRLAKEQQILEKAKAKEQEKVKGKDKEKTKAKSQPTVPASSPSPVIPFSEHGPWYFPVHPSENRLGGASGGGQHDQIPF